MVIVRVNDLVGFTQQPCRLMKYTIMLFYGNRGGWRWWCHQVRLLLADNPTYSRGKRSPVVRISTSGRRQFFFVSRESRCQHTERGGAACERSVGETVGSRFDGKEPYPGGYLIPLRHRKTSSLDECSSGGVSFERSVEDEEKDYEYSTISRVLWLQRPLKGSSCGAPFVTNRGMKGGGS